MAPEIEGTMGTTAFAERYRHRRGGTYRFITTALRESDMVPLAVYRAEYDGTTWARPLAEFADGRFQAIPDDHPVGRPTPRGD